MRHFALIGLLVLTPGLSQAERLNPFLGQWENRDESTHGGITRIEVWNTKAGPVLEAWALAGEGEASLGQPPLRLLGDHTVCRGCVEPPGGHGGRDAETPGLPPVRYGFARFDHGFSEVVLTLRLHGDGIHVEDYTLFKDESGRPDYRMQYEFHRPKASVE